MLKSKAKGTLCGSISPCKLNSFFPNLKTTTLLIGLFSVFLVKAQIEINEKVTQKPYYTTCSGNDKPELQFNLGRTLDPLTTGTYKSYVLELWEVIPNKPDEKFKSYTLSDYVTEGAQNGLFTITYNKGSIDVRDGKKYTGNAPLIQSYKRRDMTFYVKINKVIDNSPTPIATTNWFTLTAGVAPTFRTNTLEVFGPDQVNTWNIYRGDMDTVNKTTPAIFKYTPITCGSNPLTISCWERDKITGAQIGDKFWKSFTKKDNEDFVDPLIGFNISNYTADNNGFIFNMKPNHSYVLSLEYKGEFKSKVTYVTVNYKWGNWDLAIKDNKKDNGFEPLDKWDEDIYRSPNIWNKLSNSSTPNDTLHENPDYVTITGNTNKLMANVSNISNQYSPNYIGLRLFWTRARTNELWSNHWLYDTMNNYVISAVTGKRVAAGSEITISGATQANPYNTNSLPFQLPPIQPGTDYKMPFANGLNWYPPNPADFSINNGSMAGGGTYPVICLLARIQEKNSNINKDPIWYQPSGTTDTIREYVRNNNNVGTRNSWLVNSPQFLKRPPIGGTGTGWNHGFGTVMVNNPRATAIKVNLCVDIVNDNNVVETFNNHGYIEIGTTSGLYNQWLVGGSQVTNAVLQAPTLFKVTNGTHACINNITLQPNAQEQIGLRFQFINSQLPTVAKKFTYQLSQARLDTAIVVSEIIYNDTAGHTDSTALVYTPKIHPVYGSNTMYMVNVPTAPPIGWENAFATAIKPTATAANTLLVYPNPSNTQALVSMYTTTNGSSSLTITNMLGEIVKTYQYQQTGAFVETINTSNLPSGTYTVSFKHGEVIETQKLTVIH